MNRMTIGTTMEARPATESLLQTASLTKTAERRVRTLAPTVYCPESTVDECLQEQGRKT